MKTPEEWLNYDEVLGLESGLRFYDFDVDCIGTSSPANVFWPGEKVILTFQIVNNTDKDLSAKGFIDIIHCGTIGIPNDIWLPELKKLESCNPVPVEIHITPNGYTDITLDINIPEVFGGYVLVVDLGKHGRRFACSIVRTFKPDPSAIQYPKQAMDDMGADFLSRIGVKAIRMGIPYIPTSHRDYIREMETLDKKLKQYKDKNITVLLMFMEGPALIPLGNPRSFLDDNNVFLKTKQDYVWLPELDTDFRFYVKNICEKHGWPKGCVTGVHLWNEPWEGISISGWQADMLRYREIYRSMADGVMDARKTGADVLIGGCDSHSNAMDKLFPDGNMEFLPIFDFLSIHYEGMESPCLYPEWNNRTDHKGRVLIWDTESWVGNTDDRIATVVATNRSASYDRSMGIYGGYMISRPHTGESSRQRIHTPEGFREIEAVPSVWSPAAALGAVQKMLGEREFSQLLFKKGLPWIMLFHGENGKADDGTVVVCGDLGEAFGAENILYREVRGLNEISEKETLRKKLALLATDSPEYSKIQRKLKDYLALTNGVMTIDSDPAFILFDFYGNRLPLSGKKMIIPLGFQGYFLKTDGSEGSFMRLISALKNGYIEGYEPVEIICKDMQDRIEKNPEVKLQVTNILNRPLKATLSVSLGDLIIEYPKKLNLKQHESKTISVKVSGGNPSQDNTYFLKVIIDAVEDGTAFHEEVMHVNLVSNLSISVDGKLDDWQNALPQIITAEKASVSLTEAAWYPFKTFETEAEGFASGYTAFDEEYFYFAAKVADQTPHPGTYRFETRDDDAFFYPDTAYKTDPNLSFRKQDGKMKISDTDLSGLQNPADDSRILNYWEPDKNHIGIGIDLKLPFDSLSRVSFYLPNIETGRTIIEVTDLNTGVQLLTHTMEKLWKGCYLVLDLSGSVRVTFRGDWWYNVKLAAVFIDQGPENSSGYSSAKLIKEDYDTLGNWKNSYGKKGYWVFGSDPVFPPKYSAIATDESHKVALVWPEGVRHFSYRKDPVLPDNSSGIGFAYDNVQIAFNVIPMGEDGYGSHPAGTMPGYIGYKCTDYEYALNQVAPEYGGGTEIWRLLVPGMPRKHFYPRQPKSPYDGPVKDGKLSISHVGSTRITECAIPWSEIPDVKKALDSGQRIKFSFRINDNGSGAACMELARERSVSKRNSRAFHCDWKEHWANELEFSFEK